MTLLLRAALPSRWKVSAPVSASGYRPCVGIRVTWTGQRLVNDDVDGEAGRRGSRTLAILHSRCRVHWVFQNASFRDAAPD